MIKLLDILREVNSEARDVYASGKDHNVYLTKDPDKVIKTGRSEEVEHWTEVFKSDPEIYPKVYRVGYLQGSYTQMYAVIEKLDTKRAQKEFEELDKIIEKYSDDYDVRPDGGRPIEDAIVNISRSEGRYREFMEFMKNKAPQYINFFNKLYPTVVKAMKNKNIHGKFDFHSEQIGYDKSGNIKILDI